LVLIISVTTSAYRPTAAMPQTCDRPL